MKGELTPKWKAFADEWIKNGGNATQAYISAGYSENGANRERTAPGYHEPCRNPREKK